MKILYICTHNRCRSILSEAITNHLGEGIVTAISAGSQPVGEVHPLTLKYLSERSVSTEGLKSESWEDMQSFQPDLVVTVCDSAAGESCPLWMGDTRKLHWGLPDPSKIQGSDEEIAEAFASVIERIAKRVKALVELAKTGKLEQACEQGFEVGF